MILASTVKTSVNPAYFYEQELGMELRFRNGWAQAGLCPFHEDHRAGSFHVSDRGGFKCFACGARGGDVIDFISKRDEIPFAQALLKIATQEGVNDQATPQQRRQISESSKRRATAEAIRNADHAVRVASCAVVDAIKGGADLPKETMANLKKAQELSWAARKATRQYARGLG